LAEHSFIDATFGAGALGDSVREGCRERWSPIFDTSSLMALFLDNVTPEVSAVFDEHVLNLTFYLAGNVLWKAPSLQDRLTTEEHERLTAISSDLRPKLPSTRWMGCRSISLTSFSAFLYYY
jgi:hypothetical protein